MTYATYDDLVTRFGEMKLTQLTAFFQNLSPSLKEVDPWSNSQTTRPKPSAWSC